MANKRHRRWTEAETEALLQMLKDGYTIKQIAYALNRSERSTRGRYAYIKEQGKFDFPTPGINAHRLTAKEVEEIIRLRYAGFNFKAIASKLNRSDHTIKQVCFACGATNMNVTTLNWTKEEDEELKRLISDGVSYRGMARRMGRSVYAIQKRQKELGIKPKTEPKTEPKPKLKPKQKPKNPPRFKSTGNPWLDIAGQ